MIEGQPCWQYPSKETSHPDLQQAGTVVSDCNTDINSDRFVYPKLLATDIDFIRYGFLTFEFCTEVFIIKLYTHVNKIYVGTVV